MCGALVASLNELRDHMPRVEITPAMTAHCLERTDKQTGRVTCLCGQEFRSYPELRQHGMAAIRQALPAANPVPEIAA